MSDLIERLRNWCPPDEPDTDEAADEIERLRARVEELYDHRSTADAIIAADVDRVALGAQAMRIAELEAELRVAKMSKAEVVAALKGAARRVYSSMEKDDE